MTTPEGGWYLKDARQWLRDRVDEGARCPCCTQWAQVYWRTINSGMAVSAIRLFRWQAEHDGEFAHLPTLLGRRSAEEAKLRYWGLVEEEARVRPDGGRAGFWRLTAAGLEWVRGGIRLPCYVRVFDARALGPPGDFSRSGKYRPPVSIRDALGDKFDYEALLRGEG
jgi:hypothetical protein